jgi:hypothetical protein
MALRRPDPRTIVHHCSWHIRSEKDPKDAQDRIETFGRIIQFQHIRDPKGDILQSALPSLFPRKREESIGKGYLRPQSSSPSWLARSSKVRVVTTNLASTSGVTIGTHWRV